MDELKILQDLDFDLFEGNLLKQLIKKTQPPSEEWLNNTNSFVKNSQELAIRKLSLKFASNLVKENFKNIESLIKLLKEQQFVLSSEFETLNFYYSFLVQQLSTLRSTKVQKLIRGFSKASLCEYTNEMLADCLQINDAKKVICWFQEDYWILALSAFLHPLRQSVGSCFATSVCIRIQNGDPESFFSDLFDIFATQVIKRTYEGFEHSVPVNTSILSFYCDLEFSFSTVEKFRLSEECKAVLQCYSFDKGKFLSHLYQFENSTTSLRKIILSFGFSGENHAGASIVKKKSHNELSDKHEVEDLFFKDLNALLYRLYEHPLLKAWEYSLASLAESKSSILDWNISIALGLNPKEKDGVGEKAYRYLTDQLTTINEKLKGTDSRYEQIYFQLKTLERRASSASETGFDSWAKVEYHNLLSEYRALSDERDRLSIKAKKLSEMFNVIVDCLKRNIPLYFQELYDPSMQEINFSYDHDFPAGFRLIYKHGRSNPLSWTRIVNQELFVQYFVEFFRFVENDLLSHDGYENLSEFIQNLITELIQHLERNEFIESAHERVRSFRREHRCVSEEEGKLSCKPWCYISGGSLEHLLKNYYKRPAGFTKFSKRIAAPVELMVFLVDFVKQCSVAEEEQFSSNNQLSYLMSSPTHAFILEPSWLPFENILENRQLFTYTWVRDSWINPLKRNLYEIKLDFQDVEAYLRNTFSKFPELFLWIQTNLQFPFYETSIIELNRSLKKLSRNTPQKFKSIFHEQKIDQTFYEFFPRVSISDFLIKAQYIFSNLRIENSQKELLSRVLQSICNKLNPASRVTKNVMFDIVQSCFTYVKLEISQALLKEISFLALQCNMTLGLPFLFADTNWPYYKFGFMLNFETLEPELWRFSWNAQTGCPMKEFEHVFSEEEPRQWEIYSSVSEYSY